MKTFFCYETNKRLDNTKCNKNNTPYFNRSLSFWHDKVLYTFVDNEYYCTQKTKRSFLQENTKLNVYKKTILKFSSDTFGIIIELALIQLNYWTSVISSFKLLKLFLSGTLYIGK